MPQFGFFTTGPLPTLVTNPASLEQVFMYCIFVNLKVASASLAMSSGNPRSGKPSRPVMFRNLFHTVVVRFLNDTPEWERKESFSSLLKW